MPRAHNLLEESRQQQVQKPAGGDASCFLKEIETRAV